MAEATNAAALGDDNCLLPPPRILRLATDPPRRTSIPRVTLCTGAQENGNRSRRASVSPTFKPSEGTGGPSAPTASSDTSPRVVVVPALCTSVVDPAGQDLPPLFFPSSAQEETTTFGFLSPGQQLATATAMRSCRTLAVLLRLRVTQIVLGIVTLVLGASACLDPRARETLAFGVPTGSLTLLAASGHVRAVRREGPTGLQRSSCPRPAVLCVAVVAVIANAFLLALSLMSAGTGSSQNQRSLGVLLTCTTLPVLLVETAASLVRWAWASRKWTV
ncbi:uncharacterized protein LOC119393035 [Rhipicephalus sanguineus]|uniref:Uncharacterized protein n=1 Tax=Rhipicephalus sanguineus TaxID=34632 RepID=A0A9D4PRH1_RHISA|nr:uncharacterized protein LOC119393035 [Rhipicephalus sanguineus]KAH7951732.1 hypothetical protein HPB52_011779 [Rhipicephalus sanguineus]